MVCLKCKKASLVSNIKKLELSETLGVVLVLIIEIVFTIKIKSVIFLLKPWINCQSKFEKLINTRISLTDFGYTLVFTFLILFSFILISCANITKSKKGIIS